MSSNITSPDPFFTTFKVSTETNPLPLRFTLLQDDKPHPLCLLAAKQLQAYLHDQEEWEHNFGLAEGTEGVITGKMFGVLVVKTIDNRIGYLAAFSGKLAGGNHHSKFVPPVFDSLTENSFLNMGMAELNKINLEIKLNEELGVEGYKERNLIMKALRKELSRGLQNELFSSYSFLNIHGEEKSLNEIFKDAYYKNPPAGAGECAGPKLLQYAFQHQMKPLAMAEFWWGQSPKSEFWKHGQYYPCCKEKCEPILAHMLTGME